MRSATLALSFLLGQLSIPMASAELTYEPEDYEGRPHLRVKFDSGARWWLDKGSGAFSLILDKDKKDWIGYSKGTSKSANAPLRGLPNLVLGQADQAGVGCPGVDSGDTVIVDKSMVRFTSKDGAWQWTWKFGIDCATFRLEKAPQAATWAFGYRGTPSGSHAPKDIAFGTDVTGPVKAKPELAKGEKESGQWQLAYFGGKAGRILFIAQHQPDTTPDLFSFVCTDKLLAKESKDGDVVFAFGSANGTNGLLSGKEAVFTVGMVDESLPTDNNQAGIIEVIGRTLAEAMTP